MILKIPVPEWWFMPPIIVAGAALLYWLGVSLERIGDEDDAHASARCAMMLGAAATKADTIAILDKHWECP